MKKLKKLDVSDIELLPTTERELNEEETRQILGGFADTGDIYADCAGGLSGGCKPGCKPGCQSGHK